LLNQQVLASCPSPNVVDGTRLTQEKPVVLRTLVPHLSSSATLSPDSNIRLYAAAIV